MEHDGMASTLFESTRTNIMPNWKLQ